MRKKASLKDIKDSNLFLLEKLKEVEAEEKEVVTQVEREKFNLIGKPTSRVDGREIVTGRASYTHDLSFEGMLIGKILRCPHACAQILSLDLSRAMRVPGVKAAIQLQKGRIKYAGDQVAAVAACDEKSAERALGEIKVEYKILPHAVTVERAMEEGAPQVHEDKPNVEKFFEYSHGDVEKGFKEADVILERTYKTAVEIHHPLETHASVARWEGENLIVWDSTQGIFSVRDGLARALNIPASRVKVIKKYMGGGFGSKLSVNDHTIVAAKLARLTGKPVKIMLSRKENALCVGNRPSSLQTIKGGAKRDGTLTALYLKNYACGGIIPGDECADPLREIYKCPNVKVVEYTVYTNTGASRPTRAPGLVQGTFALDGFLDELAAEIGIDPLELRKKNYSLRNLADTGKPYSTKGLDKCYELGAKAIGWEKRNKKPGEGKGRVRRGLGMASQIWWGAGVPGTKAMIKLHPDGSIEAISGTQDLGGGTRTMMAVIAAESLGVSPEDITVKIGDTDYPWAVLSGGSLTVPSVGPAIRDASLKAADFLKEKVANKWGIKRDEVAIEEKRFYNQKNPAESISFKDLVRELHREEAFHGEYTGRPAGFAYNSFGAHFVEVEVDVETGKIRVLKVVAVHEVGQVVNKKTAESQVIGGVTQGVSAALFEERIVDEETGNLVNPNLSDYKIATSFDIPEIIPIFVDMVDPRISNIGAKGLGEPPRIPIAAAIANAVYNAIGVHPREIPITPERVLELLKRKELER